MKQVPSITIPMDTLLLETNQLILIPVQVNNGLKLFEYKTQPKDSLKTISKVFQNEVEDIEYFNPINKLFLRSGQSLLYIDTPHCIEKLWDRL